MYGHIGQHSLTALRHQRRGFNEVIQYLLGTEKEVTRMSKERTDPHEEEATDRSFCVVAWT